MILIIQNYPNKSFDNFQKILKIVQDMQVPYKVISKVNKLFSIKNVPSCIILTGSCNRADNPSKTALSVATITKYPYIPKLCICFAMEVFCVMMGAKLLYHDEKVKGNIQLSNKVVFANHKGYIKSNDPVIKPYVKDVYKGMAYTLEFSNLSTVCVQYHPESKKSTSYIIKDFIIKYTT